VQQSVLITGTNRGIGLEFARQYAEAGWRVHACCRDPEAATQLNALNGPDFSAHRLDVADPAGITALAQELRGQAIDLLLNNAGTYGPAATGFGRLQCEPWLDTFRINSIAPLLMAQAFLDHLEAGRGRTIATLTSKMGSLDDNGSGGSYVYRSSKAALNAALKSLALDLAPRRFKVLILHPGWVRTDMGGPRGEIAADESARRLRALIAGATASDSGRFVDIDGSTIPW
jgi:NAD(P)-dependent dehydrogenase (short-subunit alcohol dehydrogenase family)